MKTKFYYRRKNLNIFQMIPRLLSKWFGKKSQ